jgi:hypothetical protein
MVMLAALAPALATSGCAQDASDGVELTSGALTSSNGLAWNGLAWNGLAYNGLAFNGMAFNGLAWNGLAWNGMTFNGMTYNGMTYNGMTYNGMADPVVQTFVSYLVGCALPADDSVSYVVDGTTYTFEGDIGLAPEWKTRACGQDCQRWISACLLSRLNKKGEHVRISMRGEHKALKVERFELRDMTEREAAYFGNLFAGEDQIFACYPKGSRSIPRVCGDSLKGCPMKVLGSCEQVCAGPGPHHSYRDCRAPGAQGRDVFSETVTVFLAPGER